MKRTLLRMFAGFSFLFLVIASTGFAQEADLATVKAGQYDNGKMWTFDYPPVEQFQEMYDFTPDAAWFEKARLGALRLPNCTASFVSPYGLVMTNHHCARSSVDKVSKRGEDLLVTGFTAKSLDEERLVPDLYVDQLVALEDVTNEVYAALADAETDAEKTVARRDAIDAIEARILARVGGEEAGYVVQVVDLYDGGRYSAYTFKRYRDLRLVMSPELQLGYFGGDTDNFTYPRYAVDMSFFRVFEDGRPHQPEHFFQWSEKGSSEGDVVFVLGNPGSTLRLNTVSQLEWRRDVQEKDLLALLNSRIDALQDYYAENPSSTLLNQIFGLRNAQKLYTGRVKGLNDPVLMAKRADTEREFLADLDERFGPTLTADVAVPYFAIVDELASIQEDKREYASEYGAFLSMVPRSRLASATMGRAVLAMTYLQQKADGASAERLEETLASIEEIEQDPGIDRRFLAARLNDFVTYFGADDAAVVEILAGRTIDEVVDDVMAGSVLTSSEQAVAAIRADKLTSEDPALKLLAPFKQRRQEYESAFAGLTAQEKELNALHGRARFEIYGTSRPPDATFSLRIADGVVSSYDYNGSHAPAYSTFYGLYNRAYSHQNDIDGTGEWDLPERWLNPPDAFDKSTPINLVATNDIIGGNSGSPMVNKDLEVVGLIFDGNIESLPSAFIYGYGNSRAVAVDVRGMREALGDMYDMHRLVYELMEGKLVRTEEEADAIL